MSGGFDALGKAPPPERPSKHIQAEAFKLMRYEGANGRREWVWNSRDGVTPFMIQSKDGVEMSHGNWHLDQYAPLHTPKVGDRIFVDMTEELARPMAETFVTRHWDHPERPMSARYSTQEEAVEFFALLWCKDWGGHAPYLLTVTPIVAAIFAERAAMRHP